VDNLRNTLVDRCPDVAFARKGQRIKRFNVMGLITFGPLKAALDASLGFFYPELCQICHSERATADEGYVCRRCWALPNGIKFISSPFCRRCGLSFAGKITTSFECANCREMELCFVWARASVTATDIFLDLVHRYKYGRALWFEPFFRELFRRTAMPVLRMDHWDMILPVPLFPLKQREREFNQAERLANMLSQLTEIPVNNRILKRTRNTTTQTVLSRADRVGNVRNAFEVDSAAALKGAKMILVDDVLTTGATTSACAKALQDAGSGDVCVWTLCRGI